MKNFVRITSGKFKGQRITTPGEGTHPMGERERLALFNMISEYLPGATVLDAFSGSGALGIEAASRGADKVVFVESSQKAAKCIRDNLGLLTNRATASDTKRFTFKVICSRVRNTVTQQKFNLILADPPYDDFCLPEVEHLIPMLEIDGVLVLSHPGESPVLPTLTLIKSRKYAGAAISIYQTTKSCKKD